MSVMFPPWFGVRPGTLNPVEDFVMGLQIDGTNGDSVPMQDDPVKDTSIMSRVRSVLNAMAPSDWLITAGAAAFIAAGIIAVVPLGNGPGQAAVDSEDSSIFSGRFDWQPQNETDAVAALETAPPVPAEDVRSVETETIRIKPAIETENVQTASLTVSSFSAGDQRISGGCGLMLTPADDANAIVFFHELANAEGASNGYMLVDDKMLKLARIDRSGDPMGFGQYPLQVFENATGDVRALVDIDIGPAKEDTLRLPVTKGRLIVTDPANNTVTIDVLGEAGC